MTQNFILVYTYYATPWKIDSGDSIRIHTVCRALSRIFGKVIVYNLSHLVNEYTIVVKDNIVYVNFPRKLYRLIAKIIRWRMNEDLNPLIKITHYVDELIAVSKLAAELKLATLVYVFGSMTLFSFFTRLFKIKKGLVYDALANYAQTLYLRSRKKLKDILKYGLYLALHKLQLKASDLIIYPSYHDLRNAVGMFRIFNTLIVPNPPPICYKSFEEYKLLRQQRKEFDKPYFVLVAGGRSPANKEAVRITIKVFNELPSENFRLFITGPWYDMKKYVKSSSIKILGIIPYSELKKILAMSDFGLVSIFSHVAGTFLKTLAYIAAGLNLISTPWGLIGIDPSWLKNRHVIIIRDMNEYKDAIRSVISSFSFDTIAIEHRNVLLCGNMGAIFMHLRKITDLVLKHRDVD